MVATIISIGSVAIATAVTEELTSARVQRAAAMARKYMPGKLAEAFTNAADSFHDAMNDYGEDVKGDFSKQGRLEEIPQSLEHPVRKIKETATALVQSMASDEEILDPDALAERARIPMKLRRPHLRHWIASLRSQ